MWHAAYRVKRPGRPTCWRLRLATATVHLGVLGLVCLVSTAWTQGWWPEARVTVPLAAGQVDWTTGVVRSNARAEASAGSGPAASSATAFVSAVQAARQRLLEAVGQVRLDAGRTVDGVLQGARDKRQTLEELAAAAEVVQTRYLSHGAVESTVQLALFGRLTALLWPETVAPALPGTEAATAVYTGVIIDARGLALQPALFPRVLDEDGQVLYAPANVHAAVAMQRGYVAYASAFNSPQITARIGDNPLILRARRVAGPARVDLVIGRADVAQLQLSAIRLLLAQCRVVIVV